MFQIKGTHAGNTHQENTVTQIDVLLSLHTVHFKGAFTMINFILTL